MRIVLAISTVLLLVTPAHAAPANIVVGTSGYIYFNKPGANVAAHNEAMEQCLNAASQALGSTIGSGSGLAGAMIDASLTSGSALVNVENCMVVNGWRVVRIDPVQGKVLARLPQAELARRIGPWLGADVPLGDVVRTFSNEALRLESRPDGMPIPRGQTSLSARAIPAVRVQGSGLQFLPRSARPARPIESDRLGDQIPPGYAMVIYTIRGGKSALRRNLMFGRVSADPSLPAWKWDQLPDTFGSALPSRLPKGASEVEATFAFIIPAGTWRLQYFGWYAPGSMADNVDLAPTSKPGISLCLGSPSLEVASGEVVYAGAFDLSGELTPDLALDRAKVHLAAAPALASHIRPAEYRDGSKSVCGNWVIYALEFGTRR